MFDLSTATATTISTHNLYELVTQLCRSLYKQQNAGNKTNNESENAIVSKLKAIAFEIILKKSKNPHYYRQHQVVEGEQDTTYDAQRALYQHIFAAKLHFRKNDKELHKCLEFEQRMQKMQALGFFGNPLACGVVQFLIAMHEELYGNYAPNQQEAANELLVPGPFTLHANYEHSIYYPQNNWNTINDCKPRYFKGVRDMHANYEPYKPKFFASTEENQLMAMERKYGAIGKQNDVESDECTFTGMARRLCGSNMRINTGAFSLFESVSEIEKLEPAAVTIQPQRDTLLTETVNSELSKHTEAEVPRIYSWSWESLGCFGIPLAKPFITETSATLALQCMHNKSLQRPFVAKILTTKQFLKDLKCLTVGIRSDTFQYDDLMVFSMQPHITVENVLPATIENYTKEFLLCGTCYKRMQTMIMKRDYKLMFEGFIFKALCSAVDEYLLTFRQLVYATEDTNLLSFYSRIKNMIKQIDNLSFTLAIHPNVISNVAPPLGSQFLGYVYREIMRITDKQYLMLLIFILKRCCHVYFKHLQKWIFYGLLDDPSNELFVGFVDHYRPNTKYFYDRAYFVRKESVPGFFQTYEDSILLCGKYTMLLKACKPHHPLFELDYPSLSVCLSFEELQVLQANCTKYSERARELCGKPITIRDLLEARQEQKRHFKQYVQQKSKERMRKWLDEQLEQKHEAAERKKLIFEELRTQMEDAQQRKRDERRANVERELFILRSYEKREEDLMKIEHTNLRKRLEYYQELSDSLDDAECTSTTSRSRGNVRDDPRHLQRGNTPITPTSAHTDGSSFKSCSLTRDKTTDDDSSDYVECMSEDFLNEFDVTEKLIDLQHDDEDVVPSEDAISTGCLKEHREWTAVQHMRSDLQKNRLHILSGSAMEDCLQPTIKAAQLNHKRKLRPATPPPSRQQHEEFCLREQMNKSLAKSLPDINSNVTPFVELTSLQQNRQKMMTSRIGEQEELNTLDELNSNVAQAQPATVIKVNDTESADINLNVVAAASDSDLVRNRQRMMETDLFSQLDKDPACERALLKLNLNSDLARNRLKVLNSEYGILTGVSTNTLQVEGNNNVATPMSTTSDMSITENEPTNTNKLDSDNGNTQEGLKLNVDIDGVGDGIATANSMTAETPECALNTAGIAARNGFDFSDGPHKLKKNANTSEKLPSIAEAPIVTPTTANDIETSLSAQVPYQRTRELIETHFQCPARSPLIRLNKQDTNEAESQDPTDANAGKSDIAASKRICLQNMSAITITEFLQKSVIIPMNTHLELVNNEVMRMFLDDLRLIDHLRSLRNYFFLMDGEFGLIICDGIIAKLEDGYTPVKLLNYQMLHSILDNALGYSIAGNQKNAENLSFIVHDIPESFDLCSPHVLSNLCLSYRIQWPLNLILNPETLEQYANIFKYLLSVRRISFVMDRAFQILKEAIKQHGKAILKSPQYRHIQQIRHKLYNFVHALQNHITASALQASWKTFKDELMKATSIEDIYRKHTAYIKRILFLCMLNRSSIEFYNAVENIFKITLRFHKNLKSREFKLRSGEQYLTHGRYDKLVKDELEFDKFIKYTIYLGNKIVRHGYQEEIGEFINLINFNNYYTPSNVK